MKPFLKLILIIPFGFFLEPVNLHSNKIINNNLNFPIVNVQVYRSQALVTRQSKVELKKGINKIFINNLPAGLIDHSIRVHTKGVHSYKIREIRTETINIETFKTKKAIEAESLLRKSQNKLTELTQKYLALKKEEKFLLNLEFGKTTSKNYRQQYPIHVSSWKNTLDFRKSSLKKNHKKSILLLEEIDSARESLNVALTIAKRYKSQSKKKLKEIHLLIETKYSDSARIAINYRIKGAYWYPVYTARVSGKSSDRNKANVRMQKFALVKNETGEDWKQSKLSFSAANPAERLQFLSLKSWKIKPVEQVVDSFNETEASPRSPSQTSRKTKSKIRYMTQKKDERVKRRRRIKFKRMAQKDLQVQKSLQQRLSKASGYYAKNKLAIASDESKQRMNQSESLLRRYDGNLKKRDKALKRGDFQSSLQLNNEILENIDSIPFRFQKFFDEDKKKAIQGRAKSLRMIENQKYLGRLKDPVYTGRGFDYRFKAPSKETILTDGSFHKIFIKESDYKTDLFYESSPLNSKFAFLTGKMLNSGKSPILAGPVSVFFKNNYLGESSLSNINSNREFSLNLGNDENIKVFRRLNDFRMSEGLLTKKFNYKKEILITIKNSNRHAIELIVYERLPVATDEHVVIENIEFSIKPFEEVELSGLYKFRIRLKAGEKKSIKMKYNLIHPHGFLPSFRNNNSIKW